MTTSKRDISLPQLGLARLNDPLMMHPMEIPLLTELVPRALRALSDGLHLGQLLPEYNYLPSKPLLVYSYVLSVRTFMDALTADRKLLVCVSKVTVKDTFADVSYVETKGLVAVQDGEPGAV